MNNLQLFYFSNKNKEPYIDEYYISNNNTIITNDNINVNKLMKTNVYILDNISAYKIALESNNLIMQETIINNIIDGLKVKGINNSEFVSFWGLKDMSYSIYKNTLKTENLKKEFLKNIIPQFLKDRHLLYQTHGYSFSTLQAISDSKSHKGYGNVGNIKVTDMLKHYGFTHLQTNNIIDFKNKDKIFIYPDKTDSSLFQQILKEYKINFKWSKNHENKQTDFLFKINNKIFIIEHKHMKESGGGQDKQMSEIINFISYTDNNVSYISFLDGIYYNIISDENITSGKPFEQRESILRNLENNKQNYFVNTAGFNAILKYLTK